MRIGISNIAWDPAEDDLVAELLQAHRVDAIDIAPGKYFSDPRQVSDAEIDAVSKWWRDRQIEITGMQGLLFGTQGLNLFGDETAREAMLQTLVAICRIAGRLEAPRLVFGSPANRDRSGLDDQEALTRATEFLGRLGDAAEAHGVFVCLEPVPECYGSNFMRNSAETAQVVRRVDHPAIRLQLDAGALAINGESPVETVAAVAPWVGHVHASEPELKTLGDGNADHAGLGAALRSHLPDHLVTIEMRASAQEPHLEAIDRALKVAQRHYGHS